MWLVKEEELEEKFIKGGGPGGQKVNKSNSKVQITHLPTGIVVDSQYLRSQNKNRVRAREILAMKLEQMQDPENCRLATIAERKAKLKKNRAKRAAQKYKKKDALEERARIALAKNERHMNGGVPLFDVEEEIDELLGKHASVQDRAGS